MRTICVFFNKAVYAHLDNVLEYKQNVTDLDTIETNNEYIYIQSLTFCIHK